MPCGAMKFPGRTGFSPPIWETMVASGSQTVTRAMLCIDYTPAVAAELRAIRFHPRTSFESTGLPTERQYGLFGRYSLAPDWSLSAETLSREPGNLLRLTRQRRTPM